MRLVLSKSHHHRNRELELLCKSMSFDKGLQLSFLKQSTIIAVIKHKEKSLPFHTSCNYTKQATPSNGNTMDHKSI